MAGHRRREDRTLDEFQTVLNRAVGLSQDLLWFFGTDQDYWNSAIQYKRPGEIEQSLSGLLRSGEEYDAGETTIGQINQVENLLTPVRDDRDVLLQVMQDLDNILIERVNQTEIETITEQSAGGTKNALFDLYEYLSDSERANELIEPFNAVNYFRNESSHDKVQKGWEEALEELDVEGDSDVLELYRYCPVE